MVQNPIFSPLWLRACSWLAPCISIKGSWVQPRAREEKGEASYLAFVLFWHQKPKRLLSLMPSKQQVTNSLHSIMCVQVVCSLRVCSTETCWTRPKPTGAPFPRAPCWPMAVSPATRQMDPPLSFVPVLEPGPSSHHAASGASVSKFKNTNTGLSRARIFYFLFCVKFVCLLCSHTRLPVFSEEGILACLKAACYSWWSV